MNKQVISKEKIIDISKEMIAQDGFNSISIRSIAKKGNVSIGVIYNYFQNKDEILMATIEAIFKEIGKELLLNNDISFIKMVNDIFNTFKNGSNKYPNFFSLHTLMISSNERQKGREVMNDYFKELKKRLLKCLNNDLDVNQSIFNDLNKEKYIDFVFTNILSLLINHENNCEVLLFSIKHTIY